MPILCIYLFRYLFDWCWRCSREYFTKAHMMAACIMMRRNRAVPRRNPHGLPQVSIRSIYPSIIIFSYFDLDFQCQVSNGLCSGMMMVGSLPNKGGHQIDFTTSWLAKVSRHAIHPKQPLCPHLWTRSRSGIGIISRATKSDILYVQVSYFETNCNAI